MWIAAATYCAVLAPKTLLATLIGVLGMAHFSLGNVTILQSILANSFVTVSDKRVGIRCLNNAMMKCAILLWSFKHSSSVCQLHINPAAINITATSAMQNYRYNLIVFIVFALNIYTREGVGCISQWRESWKCCDQTPLSYRLASAHTHVNIKTTTLSSQATPSSYTVTTDSEH